MSNYNEILKRYWGYDDFRGVQREIIESIGSGHDTLGLMPTGGGKSVTFQVPALSMEGVCIVITPLIALMKDQVHHLRQRGIIAAAIYSGMQRDDIIRILENCILGTTKLLYISPERLGSDLFQAKLRHMRVSFITVDEAHCISQWGYDFRPSYLKIADIRRICPDVPVLALTATATPKVVDDICAKLTSSTSFRVFRMSFERKNLTYLVSHATDKQADLIHLLDGMKGSAIVYVRSRRHAREVAEMLTEAGLSATFYHAGLEHAVKDQRQRDWQHDRVRIMVATNAFGMGIDKSDVRMVVHYDCPDSIEAYFQEAGRAGRDGQPARAILLYNATDEPKLHKRVKDTFPEKDYIRKVYEHLAYYYQIATGDGYGVTREFNIDDFCHKFKHFPVPVHSSLQILQRAGYIEYLEEQDNQARVKFIVTRDDLYRLRGDTPHEEKVIVALLRNYGGLFADYGFVDESLIAHQCGLKPNDVYQTLKLLSEKHVIQFIPRKQVPYVRYLQRREDSEHVMLPPAVYEERLAQYQERIEAMLRYAKDDSKCRSRQLLEYFGEKNVRDCGMCDVCHNASKADIQQVQQQILRLLADRKQHHLTELYRLQLPKEELDQALAYLLKEEYIIQQDGYLLIP
ncbi:MAG: RecQ family ATP-dependent DNA helicase [Prevotella sp.]|nr:RecQ family ATP-dependent DNA helicase [Prevotella sp.]